MSPLHVNGTANGIRANLEADGLRALSRLTLYRRGDPNSLAFFDIGLNAPTAFSAPCSRANGLPGGYAAVGALRAPRVAELQRDPRGRRPLLLLQRPAHAPDDLLRLRALVAELGSQRALARDLPERLKLLDRLVLLRRVELRVRRPQVEEGFLMIVALVAVASLFGCLVLAHRARDVPLDLAYVAKECVQVEEVLVV